MKLLDCVLKSLLLLLLPPLLLLLLLRCVCAGRCQAALRWQVPHDAGVCRIRCGTANGTIVLSGAAPALRLKQ
jgi:hypothetical protein